MTEEWNPSISMVGYEVSNMGNIRHSERKQNLTQMSNGKGYMCVRKKIDGKGKNYYVHRLVAEVYCDNNLNCLEVNHIDCDKSNNNYLNLEWCTRIDNIHHAISMGRCVMTDERKAKLEVSRKLASATHMKRVAIIGTDGMLLGIYDSLTDASKVLGVSVTSACRAARERKSTCMGNKLILI